MVNKLLYITSKFFLNFFEYVSGIKINSEYLMDNDIENCCLVNDTTNTYTE
jgi:hypothetical protein